LSFVHGLFEVDQQRLASLQPLLDLVCPISAEPVPLLHSAEPAPDLVQVLRDLFGFLECVVLAEMFEFDLFDELGFALLDDLGVFVRPENAERADDARLVARAQPGDIEARVFATKSFDSGENLRELVFQLIELRQNTDALL